jgi:hypothetical protein
MIIGKFRLINPSPRRWPPGFWLGWPAWSFGPSQLDKRLWFTVLSLFEALFVNKRVDYGKKIGFCLD